MSKKKWFFEGKSDSDEADSNIESAKEALIFSAAAAYLNHGNEIRFSSGTEPLTDVSVAVLSVVMPDLGKANKFANQLIAKSDELVEMYKEILNEDSGETSRVLRPIEVGLPTPLTESGIRATITAKSFDLFQLTEEPIQAFLGSREDGLTVITTSYVLSDIEKGRKLSRFLENRMDKVLDYMCSLEAGLPQKRPIKRRPPLN